MKSNINNLLMGKKPMQSKVKILKNFDIVMNETIAAYSQRAMNWEDSIALLIKNTLRYPFIAKKDLRAVVRQSIKDTPEDWTFDERDKMRRLLK